MRRAAIVLAAATLATGCGDDAWYRAAGHPRGVLITRADVEADTCDFYC